MSSDLFVFDGSFFSDSFYPFTDSPIDILQDFPDNHHPTLQDQVDETNSFEQIASALLSSSPPSHQLENLSLFQTTHLQNASNSADPFAEVKTEECLVPFHSSYNYQPFGPQSYDDAQNTLKMMQRSYSSNSFDGKPSFLFQPHVDSLMESPNFQPQIMSSPETTFPTGQIRRVCSTGDLQKIKANHRLSPSPLTTDSAFIEETNFKVGRYSAEERKERIHRYRAKRSLRNFNKTIKYACRKTLADNRPRIRGRFARNDEIRDIS
ncbi:hypothetical protein F0562_013207 [Nyssa sinensis]|uniref:CCT domain-containing protein n=1 Tax=Nyssa sinensis TaxID=561372 RepID=A0A5J4ZYB4_9ASTE|nr:hypothetical protein F0562_013207 [Nyssa sinensis]